RDAPIHRKPGSVSGIHPQLHQDPPLPASGVGPAVLLQGFPSCDSRYDQDPGAQWAHRENACAAPLHSPPCRTGVLAAIEVALALKSTEDEAWSVAREAITCHDCVRSGC